MPRVHIIAIVSIAELDFGERWEDGLVDFAAGLRRNDLHQSKLAKIGRTLAGKFSPLVLPAERKVSPDGELPYFRFSEPKTSDCVGPKVFPPPLSLFAGVGLVGRSASASVSVGLPFFG